MAITFQNGRCNFFCIRANFKPKINSSDANQFSRFLAHRIYSAMLASYNFEISVLIQYFDRKLKFQYIFQFIKVPLNAIDNFFPKEIHINQLLLLFASHS